MKKQDDLKAVKRKDGRYAVRKRGGGFLKGDDKMEFLAGKGLITKPAKKEEPAAEEATTEESAES